MTHPLPLLASALGVVLLAGCATPRAVLDEANNGVSLTAALQSSLSEFRKTQSQLAQGRIESIRRQRTLIALYDADAEFDARIQLAAGRTAEAALFQQLRELTDSRVKDADNLSAALAALDARMSKLVSPLPESTDKLLSVQKTMASLGEELSPRERLKETAAFARELKKQVDENRAKSDAAAASASAAAPVQAGPQSAGAH